MRGGTTPQRRKKPKPRSKVIRWSDYANKEERVEALAIALAETGIPIRRAPADDFDEEDSLIEAIVLKTIFR